MMISKILDRLAARLVVIAGCGALLAGFAAGGAQAQGTQFPPPGFNADELAGGSALPAAPPADTRTGIQPPPAPGGAAPDPFAPPEMRQATAAEVQEEIRERAFNAALTGLLPMRPGEIRAVLERFDETQQAVEVPIYPYPQPEVVVQTLSLDPGARPPEIKVAVGHVATLNILDITGAAWPIQDISWAGNFELVNPEPGGSVVRITPTSEFAYGNMSIRLLELQTPVTFIIRAHRDTVHYRFDARVPEYGPAATMPIIEGGTSLVAGDSILGAILDGVPPAGAERLNVSGVDGRTSAYIFGSKTYVRTPLTLLSPGWTGSVSSADGMKVYAMAGAPVLLLSDRGQMVRARIGRGEDDNE